MMMKAYLKSARHILEDRLKESASNKGASDSIRIAQVADPLDMTQQASERELAVRMLDQESALVHRIRSAISRIDDGCYGICLRCEEEIAPKRLKAIPWAELCIHCQEDADQQRHMASSEYWTEAA